MFKYEFGNRVAVVNRVAREELIEEVTFELRLK